MELAVARLTQARQGEGRSLIQFVESRLAGISDLVAAVKTRTPELLSAYEQKIDRKTGNKPGKGRQPQPGPSPWKRP